MSRQLLKATTILTLFSLLFTWPPARLRGYWRQLFDPDARKRRVGWRLIGRGARLHLNRLLSGWRGGRDDFGLIFPAWYES